MDTVNNQNNHLASYGATGSQLSNLSGNGVFAGAAVTPTVPYRTAGLLLPIDALPNSSASTTRAVSTTDATTFLMRCFNVLSKQQWTLAFELFRAVKPETQRQGLLRVTGLACAVYPQCPRFVGQMWALFHQQPFPASKMTSLILDRIETLQTRNRNKEAFELLTELFDLEAGNIKDGLPCNNHQVNLALTDFWCRTNDNLSAKKLLLATFRQESGKLESGRPCRYLDTNVRMAQYCLAAGELDLVVKLSIATSTTDIDLKPVRRVIHFIRHAQGQHNLAMRNDPYNWHLGTNLLDPVLTRAGMRQCEEFARTTAQHLNSAQLVVVSPMNRTIQTATHSLPQLVNRVQWIALESVREQVATHLCDQRMPLFWHRANYRHVNFDGITFDSDMLKTAYQQYESSEPSRHVIQRCLEFIKWLSNRPEQEIVVVSHYNFLFHLFAYVLTVSGSGHEVTVNSGIDCKQPCNPTKNFRNCEMRSVVLRTFPE